jgi:hypothetical protein
VSRRLIVFRFDRDPLVCRNHIAHLRRLNPAIPIFGIFGGDSYKRAAFQFGRKLVLGLDGFYASPASRTWNWRHGDLVLRSWFEDEGHAIPFDIAHYLEWDLVVLDTLERVFGHVPTEAIGLTALTPLSQIENSWAWTTGSNREGFRHLLSYAAETWDYSGSPYGCLGLGPCIPRGFLERYSSLDAQSSGNDELRYPLLAQVFGIQMIDTGLRRAWQDEAEDSIFNVGGPPIAREVITAELSKLDGRRAFHPVRYQIGRRL